MIRTLRKFCNVFARFADRRALKIDVRFTREDRSRVQSHQTAGSVMGQVLQIAHRFDAGAKLRMIVSAHPIRADGTSSRWEFFFDLPRRRAKLECGWFLALDETGEVSGPACIEVVSRQFPKRGGTVQQLVSDGKLRYGHLKKLWRKELRRRSDLPEQFVDTDQAIQMMKKDGLDVSSMEFTFSSEQTGGDLFCWVAQTGERSFQVPLEQPAV